jgi:RNA polymerase-binding transcription factor DksA
MKLTEAGKASSPPEGLHRRACVECGSVLPREQLDARPEAKRCRRCEAEEGRRRAWRSYPPL